jgi:hypothetical protein
MGVVLMLPYVLPSVKEHNRTAVLLNQLGLLATVEKSVTALLPAIVQHGLTGVRVQPMDQYVTNTNIAAMLHASKFADAATTLTAVVGGQPLLPVLLRLLLAGVAEFHILFLLLHPLQIRHLMSILIDPVRPLVVTWLMWAYL